MCLNYKLSIFKNFSKFWFIVMTFFRAWWKRQPWDVDCRPSTTEVFYWSTSTRLSYSTGRLRPLRFSTGRRRQIEKLSLVDGRRRRPLSYSSGRRRPVENLSFHHSRRSIISFLLNLINLKTFHSFLGVLSVQLTHLFLNI